jgi:hypothetical protein
MKKVFTLLSVGLFGLAVSSQAQIVTSQDFESVTAPALPATWSQTAAVTIAGSVGWKTGTNTTLGSQNFAPSAHTNFVAVNDDLDSAANNSNSLLKSNSFSLTGVSGAYAKFDLSYFASTYAGATETLTLESSIDNGATWQLVQTIAGNTTSVWETRYISISGLNNAANVMLGFRYKDGSGWLYGAAIDNFTVLVPPALDVANLAVGVQRYSIIGDSVSFLFKNVGSTAITSLAASFSVNGNTPVAQTFTGLNVAPFTSQVLTFSNTLTGITATPSQYNIQVVISQINGTPDPNMADNTQGDHFIGGTTGVTRNALIEEFSSSTCAPCAALNGVMDPVVTANNPNVPASNFNLVRYQMNWPAPGTDASYNPDGVTRRTYYNVTGIPDEFANGFEGPLSSASTATDVQNEINFAKSDITVMTISGTGSINGTTHTISGSVSVTPNFTATGTYHVLITAAERHYVNNSTATGHTTSQTDFYSVERMMFPNGTGTAVTSWTAGTAQNFNFSRPYVVGNPAQGNYNFWGPASNSDIIAYVQDDSSKEIIQSAVLTTTTTGFQTISTSVNGINVYPNPASTEAYVTFVTAANEKVQVDVLDIFGRTVFTNTDTYTVGGQQVVIPTATLAAGVYNVKISSNNGSVTERLSVVK